MEGHTTNLRVKLPLACLLLQLLTILLFAVFVRYEEEQTSPASGPEEGDKSQPVEAFYKAYPSFQDIHAMVFVGFGFLMTFLERYSFGGVAFSFLIAALAIQWSVLIQGFFHSFHQGKIYVGVGSVIRADLCAGAVLVSFGALLGKTSPLQLLLMAGLEATLFGVNEYVLLGCLGARDSGGSMTVHAFGAYFGLTVSRMLYRPNLEKHRQREASTYHSDLFAMIGTLFLWVFWPSFNSALAAPEGSIQQRAVVNSYFSLAGSTLATFATSVLLDPQGRLDMRLVQNAALAGGVVVGTSAEMTLTPFGALTGGVLAGFVSALGFRFLTPILASKLKTQDTCGVHNLHGVPGVLGALLGALVAALATADTYGDGMAKVFPQVANGRRSPGEQGAIQLLGLFVTLGMAAIGGGLTGAVLKLRVFGSPPDALCFEDQVYWEVPEELHARHLHVEVVSAQEETLEGPSARQDSAQEVNGVCS